MLGYKTSLKQTNIGKTAAPSVNIDANDVWNPGFPCTSGTSKGYPWHRHEPCHFQSAIIHIGTERCSSAPNTLLGTRTIKRCIIDYLILCR